MAFEWLIPWHYWEHHIRSYCRELNIKVFDTTEGINFCNCIIGCTSVWKCSFQIKFVLICHLNDLPFWHFKNFKYFFEFISEDIFFLHLETIFHKTASQFAYSSHHLVILQFILTIIISTFIPKNKWRDENFHLLHNDW